VSRSAVRDGLHEIASAADRQATQRFAQWHFGGNLAAARARGKEHAMNRDQVKGRATQAKGKAKEAAGKAMGNERMKTEGQAEQVAGKTQSTAGDLKHKVARKIDKI
jgi:uncharacterized protein YjbJ (UPF0337 family)